MSGETDQKAVVFLIGTGDLRRFFKSWPDRMRLAVCLEADGACKMLVYREEEGPRFLARLRRALGLRAEEICLIPETAGYPSRRILYSEEKQLFTLVRNAPEIVEEAKDYSLNYTYALDEGIDPLAFLNLEQPVKQEPKQEVSETSPVEPERPRQRLNLTIPEPLEEEPDEVEPIAEQALPKFMQKAGFAGPSTAFQSIAELQTQKAAPKSVYIHAEQDGWIAIDLPGCLGGQVTVSNPGRIFLRDDRKVLAVHSDLVARDSGFLPERINLSTKFLPEGVRQILVNNAGYANLSFEDGFLFVEITRTTPTPAGALPKLWPQQGGTPWRLWASAAAILGVAAFSLQSALAPRTVSETDQTIDWTQFQSGSLENINNKAPDHIG